MPRKPPHPKKRPVAAAHELVSLYAITPGGLESVLAEEALTSLAAIGPVAEAGAVRFRLRTPPPAPVRLLSCERLALLVREAVGDYAASRGFAEVRGKLARTDFGRALAMLPEVGVGPPKTFSVVAHVAGACDFAFYDVQRDGPMILAKRLGLEPVEERPDILVHVSCAPESLLIGLCLPLLPLSPAARPHRDLPRALLGALVHLAGPAARVATADPDCGEGELLHAWRAAAGPGRLLGMTFGSRAPDQAEPPPWAVRASHRAWPVADGRLSRVLSLAPRLKSPAELARLLDETARCLAAGGRAAYAFLGGHDMQPAIAANPRLALERMVRVSLGKGPRTIAVLTGAQGAPSHRSPVTAGDRARATGRMGGVVAEKRQKRATRPQRPGSGRPRGPRR